MLSRANQYRLFNIQRRGIFQEGLLILCCVLLNAETGLRRVMDDFVIHVGDVHHVTNCVSALAQKPPQHVHRHKGSEIADVPVVVNRGTARIHANLIVVH